MSSHSEYPGSLSRRKLIKALKRLGFVINTAGGKGDHYKIIWPPTQKSVTIPSQTLERYQLGYIIPEIEKISSVKWKEIKDEL